MAKVKEFPSKTQQVVSVSRPRIILGFSLGFDVGAAIIKNGKVLAAVNEERLSRIKNDKVFPAQAITECLRIAGITPGEIDEIAFSNYEYDTLYQLIRRYTRNGHIDSHVLMDKYKQLTENPYLRQTMFTLMKRDREFQVGMYEEAIQGIKYLLSELGISDRKVTRVEHHMTHAIAAYYFSNFDPSENTLVVTSDGFGDGLSATVSLAKSGKIERINQSPLAGSLALIYQFVTGGLGWKMHQHEGKVTGLAAYGNPDVTIKEFRNMVVLNQKGEFQWNFEYLNQKMQEIIPTLEQVSSPINSFYHFEMMRDYIFDWVRNSKYSREDIAAGLQKFTEEAIQSWLSFIIAQLRQQKQINKFNVCLAGGLFANVKVNQRVHEIPEVTKIFVFPAMGDTGLGLGAAIALHVQNKPVIPIKLENVFFGPEYDEEDVRQEIAHFNLKYHKYADINKIIAFLVSEGNLVAKVSGRMEYGPRALTHRSILFNCNDRSVNTWLNQQLGRDEIMPYAPVLKAENAKKCFKDFEGVEYTSRFMTVTKDATEFFVENCPAAVHIDNTARPQIVYKNEIPDMWEILDEYEKLTGKVALINTSYNEHNHPIVCTPEEAIRTFQNSNIHYLAIGNYLIAREDKPIPKPRG